MMSAVPASGRSSSALTETPRNGGISYWWADIGIPTPRPALPGSTTADVCILGAGFSGLWTAYHLKLARPALEVVVLEQEFAGFGASGRNGGWLTDGFAAGSGEIEAKYGHAAALALRRAMAVTVDEVIEICAREEIDADIQRSGMLRVARGEAQAKRLRDSWLDEQRWMPVSEGTLELDQAEVKERVNVAGATGGLWHPGGARVHPAKLARGLGLAAERHGVKIYEGTTVEQVSAGYARTDHGTVRSPIVLNCLEGFMCTLPGLRRARLPLNSAMVVTAPLPAAVWDEIGWDAAELLGDFAHAYIYAQRTADGRIALGGRGVPYRFGSRIDDHGRTQPRTIGSLIAALHEHFPATASVPIEQAWCGVLGVSRDWFPSVGFDRSTGLGVAGGYVGNGVGAAHLAGRTLCDLVLANESELTTLPWVNHRSRRWEPEPLRWAGVQLVYGLYRLADRRERGGLPRTSAFARLADVIAGR
jgi:glycine/D-amino acid oxidase-like deaminating enzyme